MLFGIANKSDITNEDLEKMSELVSYYVGSIDNINKEHQQGLVCPMLFFCKHLSLVVKK